MTERFMWKEIQAKPDGSVMKATRKINKDSSISDKFEHNMNKTGDKKSKIRCRIIVENRRNFVYNERQERQVELYVYYWIL